MKPAAELAPGRYRFATAVRSGKREKVTRYPAAGDVFLRNNIALRALTDFPKTFSYPILELDGESEPACLD